MQKNWMKYKNWIPYTLILFFMIVTGIYFYYGRVEDIAKGDNGMYFLRDVAMEESVYLSEKELVQTYTTSRDHLSKIGLSFSAENDIQGLVLHVELREPGKQSFEHWDVDAKDLHLDGGFDFFVLADKMVGKDKEIEIALSVVGESQGKLKVHYSNNKMEYGTLKINKSEMQGNLALAMCGPVQYVGKVFVVITGILILLMLVVMLLLRKSKNLKLENLFLLIGIVFGGLYLLIFSPGSEPDGKAHIISSYYYADVLTGREAVDTEGKVLGRADDVRMNGYTDFLGLDNFNTTKENLFSKIENTETEAFFRGKLSSPFTAHLPQIIGTTIGLAFNQNTVITLYLGKAFALIFYLMCCYFAIKFMPFGKMIILFTALLPFSLEIATSHSYDCTVLALSMLMTGYIFYLKYTSIKIGIKEIGFWVLLTMWISPCKIIYIFISLLILLVPAKKFGKKKYYWISAGVSLGAGGVALAVSRMSMITSTISGNNGEYITIKMFFENLKHSLLMIVRTLDVHMDEYLRQMFGGVYSWFDVTIQWTFVIAYILLFGMVLLSVQGEKDYLKKNDKIGIGLILVLVIAAIAASMMFSWTPVGAPQIEGIQGRYVLPVLPLIGLLFRNRLLTFQKNVDGQLLIGMVLLQFMTIMQLFATVISR